MGDAGRPRTGSATGPRGSGFASRAARVARRCAPPSPRCVPAPAAATDDALARAGLAYVGDWRTSRLDAEGFRRLSLALAIAGDPDLVVLDDPWVLADTLREIAAARARGAAVLVAAQRPGGLGPALGRRLVLVDGVAR